MYMVFVNYVDQREASSVEADGDFSILKGRLFYNSPCIFWEVSQWLPSYATICTMMKSKAWNDGWVSTPILTRLDTIFLRPSTPRGIIPDRWRYGIQRHGYMMKYAPLYLLLFFEWLEQENVYWGITSQRNDSTCEADCSTPRKHIRVGL